MDIKKFIPGTTAYYVPESRSLEIKKTTILRVGKKYVYTTTHRFCKFENKNLGNFLSSNSDTGFNDKLFLTEEDAAEYIEQHDSWLKIKRAFDRSKFTDFSSEQYRKLKEILGI